MKKNTSAGLKQLYLRVLLHVFLGAESGDWQSRLTANKSP